MRKVLSLRRGWLLSVLSTLGVLLVVLTVG